MIDVKQAENIIQNHLKPLLAVGLPLEKATGRVLLENIYADTDFPPFDRVMMDGIAIRFSVLQEGNREFKIEGIQAAGSPKKSLLNNKNCIEVMTGAVLPSDSDTVIPYEHIKIDEGSQTATIIKVPESKGKNIHNQGMDKKAGDLLIEKGRRISAAEIAVMASVGKTDILVAKNPRIAIISTGDELIDINEKPLPHQIRRSNVYALDAECKRLGLATSLFHINDDPAKLKSNLSTILKDHDVILMSGGVSMGKFDYVPDILTESGVQKHFHKVKQKPGKPFWFGTKAEECFVFAFPGNPVSTFMCFHKYFVPWLNNSLGLKEQLKFATLEEDFEFGASLTYFLQVKEMPNDKGIRSVKPMKGRGSGDHANLIDATGFLELPAEKDHYLKGEAYPYYAFR